MLSSVAETVAMLTERIDGLKERCANWRLELRDYTDTRFKGHDADHEHLQRAVDKAQKAEDVRALLVSDRADRENGIREQLREQASRLTSIDMHHSLADRVGKIEVVVPTLVNATSLGEREKSIDSRFKALENITPLLAVGSITDERLKRLEQALPGYLTVADFTARTTVINNSLDRINNTLSRLSGLGGAGVLIALLLGFIALAQQIGA